MNPLFNTRIPFPTMVDAYQAGMFNQIPKGMENFQCSQLVHRKPFHENEHRIISAGLQIFADVIESTRITQNDIAEAYEFYKDFRASVGGLTEYPWPMQMFQQIVDEYDGRLPIVITGLPDGFAHYVGEPSVQIWTDAPGMGELVGWIESELLPYIWTTSVVATRGRIRKDKFFKIYREIYPSITSDIDLQNIFLYKFHDFGRRGGANSMLTGYAHLINWPGTDTCDSAYYVKKYLNNNEHFGACSIPAMAHRTVTPWVSEYEAYDNMIKLYGDDLVSIVADSYDFYNGCDYLASKANLFKKKGGVLIVRPDSGDPLDCIIYALNRLDEKFGSTTQDVGLKIINGAAVIQGDGVSDEDIFERLIPEIIAHGYCPSNVAFGMGQHNHKALRSDLETAYKTCCVGNDKFDRDLILSNDNLDDDFTVPVMKGANSAFKRSYPTPVAFDHLVTLDNRFASKSRIQSIGYRQLNSNDIGIFHEYYNYKKEITSRVKFSETQKYAFETWNSLDNQAPKNCGNISQIILRQQERYMITQIDNKPL